MSADKLIDCTTVSSFTLLQCAVYRNDVDVVQLLINGGVDINGRCSGGRTALTVAWVLALTHMRKLLEDNGATE
jgi:ankyrin repeat protein